MTCQRLEIIDTTLRDGEQAPGVAFTPAQRLRIAAGLDEAGVDEIEVGTPAMGADERDSIRDIVAISPHCRLTAWCRARESDLDHASDCGLSAVHISFPVSDIHLRVLRRSFDEIRSDVYSLVALARRRFKFVSVGAQDASRTPLNNLLDFAAAVQDAGADRIRLADTVGVWDPARVLEVVGVIARAVTIPVGVHMHNDLGMATANTLVALQAGARSADVTVLGLGERAGNAALEQVTMALHLAGRAEAMRIEPRRLTDLCRLVASAARRPIPIDKPIVGPAAFAHESGIHVHAMSRDPRAYEPFAPDAVGRSNRRIVIGKHSGRAALRQALVSTGTEPDEGSLGRLVALVRSRAVESGGDISLSELRRLYRQVTASIDATVSQ